MASTTLTLIAFLTLTAWRFVFTGLGIGRLVRQRRSGLLGQGLRLSQADVRVLAGYHQQCSDGLGSVGRSDRAKTYLRRVVALTGATQIEGGYALNVGTTKFQVRDKYVRRLRDATDPKWPYEETCFYPAYKAMPKAEQIATALMQLRNNPSLFDKWAAQRSLAFKADGEVFTRT